jgi:hypothetical protein
MGNIRPQSTYSLMVSIYLWRQLLLRAWTCARTCQSAFLPGVLHQQVLESLLAAGWAAVALLLFACGLLQGLEEGAHGVRVAEAALAEVDSVEGPQEWW